MGLSHSLLLFLILFHNRIRIGIFEKIYLRNIEWDRKQRRIRVAGVDIVKDLVLPVIERMVELEDIEFVKEGKSGLRVYIDKDGNR